jgi:hypothetical protein
MKTRGSWTLLLSPIRKPARLFSTAGQVVIMWNLRRMFLHIGMYCGIRHL